MRFTTAAAEWAAALPFLYKKIMRLRSDGAPFIQKNCTRDVKPPPIAPPTLQQCPACRPVPALLGRWAAVPCRPTVVRRRPPHSTSPGPIGPAHSLFSQPESPMCRIGLQNIASTVLKRGNFSLVKHPSKIAPLHLHRSTQNSLYKFPYPNFHTSQTLIPP